MGVGERGRGGAGGLAGVGPLGTGQDRQGLARPALTLPKHRWKTVAGPLKLDTRIVDKPWGRRGIDPRFG
jgi:hypothetical protein